MSESDASPVRTSQPDAGAALEGTVSGGVIRREGDSAAWIAGVVLVVCGTAKSAYAGVQLARYSAVPPEAFGGGDPSALLLASIEAGAWALVMLSGLGLIYGMRQRRKTAATWAYLGSAASAVGVGTSIWAWYLTAFVRVRTPLPILWGSLMAAHLLTSLLPGAICAGLSAFARHVLVRGRTSQG